MRRGRLVASAVAVLTLALALGACGSDGDGLNGAARARLTTLVEQVRGAATARDGPGARHALTELQQAVAVYVKHGDISSERAAQILTASAAVRDRITLLDPPATTTTSTTTTLGNEGPRHDADQDGKRNDRKGKGNGGHDG